MTTRSLLLQPLEALGRPLPARSSLRRLGVLAAGILALVLVAACGGGDGDGNEDDSVSVSPASVTATGSPTATEGTATATPAPVPDRPSDLFAGGEVLAEYLASDGVDLEGCLPELEREWGLAPIVGKRCFLVDIDGDNRDEYIYVITAPSASSVQLPGDVWFFEDEERDYAFTQSARGLTAEALENVAVVGMQDLTNDDRPEVVVLWETCGASTCLTHVIVASQHAGNLQNLVGDAIEVTSLESFEIGAQGQLLLRGGIGGSVGAGPQRSMTTQLRWVGTSFQVAEVPNEPVYLIHLVNDADEALSLGLYSEAIQLFEAAAADTELKDWKEEIGEDPGREELRAYSLFRAGLAAQRSGDPARARSYFERVATQYDDTLHGSGADAYLRARERGESPNEACASMEEFLSQPPLGNLVAEFWDFGEETRDRGVQTICR